MKRILFAVAALGMLVLTSCETTREITLNADGTGEYSNTSDFSSLVSIAKMGDQEGKLSDMEEKKVDTTVSLKELTDSLDFLTPEEKKLANTGTFTVSMDLEEDKMIATVKLPFKKIDELSKLEKLSASILEQGVKKIMSEGKGGEGLDELKMGGGGIDNYYTTTYTANKIEKKLLADKYAKVNDDQALASLKEIAGEGLPMDNKLVINLPRPAKSVTGKNAVLSPDKKKVTITESPQDFFDDGKSFEFSIVF